MRARRLVIALSTVALVAPPAVLLTTALAGSPGPLGTSCTATTSSDGVSYQFCTGEIASFDGTNLDTDITLPAGWTTTAGPLPTIVMLHGWSGDKHDWEATTKAGDGADTYHWNNVWFASRGFAVVNYTARGFKESCGFADTNPVTDPVVCAKTGTHLADRRWEIRDSQTLLADLIHARVADPKRLAATGGSYGGGQSWLLATSLPWNATTPSGQQIKVQLSAAVPKYPWTDLLYSLTPNGRESDDKYTSSMDAKHSTPFGIPKATYIAGLYAVGRATGQGRYDPVDGIPDNLSTNLDASFVRTMVVGEPYDPDPVLKLIDSDYVNRSAYYANDYFAAIKAGTVKEVPVFSIQGWTDPLFPPVETLQMYRKLKFYDANYPVYMAFGDIGHSNAQNPGWQWQHLNDQGNQFLGQFLLGQGNGRPTTNVFALLTDCKQQGVNVPHSVLSGTSWDKFAPGTVTLKSSSGRTTTSVDTDPQTGLAVDPITHGGCETTSASGSDASTTWTWTVPASGFNLLGLPKLNLHYSMSGVDATLGFYVWDVNPQSGTRTLVTRGEWRIATLGGDAAAGTLRTALNGNGWVFVGGHQIQLQVTQTDVPYLRPDNLPSSVAVQSPVLTLPIASAFTTTLVAP